MVRLYQGKLSEKDMAIEIFAHAILFTLGILAGIIAVFSAIAFLKVIRVIYKIITIISAIAAGTASLYLISHSYVVDIQINKKDNRQKYYKLIWNIF